MITQKSPNVHVYQHKLESINDSALVLVASDAHFDNPKCRRDILKADLDEALEKGARVIIPGDFFCLMQGNYDPRKSKKDLLPQHQVSNYLDAVVEEGVEWLRPYASIIDVIGYGNHETSILKRMETDVLERLAFGLNLTAKPASPVVTGGYGGWYIFNSDYNGARKPFRIKYFHGSGGGAPVTKGTIQHNRMATSVHGADAIVMGHVHNDYEVTYAVERLNTNFEVETHHVLMVRSSTYKDEYFLKEGAQAGGWAVERGMAPKPIGGRWIELYYSRAGGQFRVNGRSYRTKNYYL